MGIEHLPVKHGSPTRGVPGWDIRVVDEQGGAMEEVLRAHPDVAECAVIGVADPCLKPIRLETIRR